MATLLVTLSLNLAVSDLRGNKTYAFIAETAGRACSAKRPATKPPCEGKSNHRILIGAMLAYEADTLQIALAEYDGVADILITENRGVHNPKEKSFLKPFLLWPTLQSRPEFSVRESLVFFHECTGRRHSNEMWEAERSDDRCMSQAIKKHASDYDVFIVGSVDEILARETLLKLKHCDLPSFPANGGIGMPLGKLGRSFRNDWPIPENPNAFSLPTIYGRQHAEPGRAVRHIGSIGPSIQGGLHMTNYCFIPAMTLKELWTTSYGHRHLDTCSSIKALKEKCYHMLRHRVTPGTGPETITPWLLEACPDAFPSWYGNIDDRDVAFVSMANC